MIVVGEERNVRAPRELYRLITDFGGRNPHGDPMYRLVWGWERKEWKGGMRENGTAFLALVPKYPKRERFHLEVWMPPEKYGDREQWAKDTHKLIDGQIVEILGPYPAEGDYEHIWECSDTDGSFLHPTENMMLRAIRQHKTALNMDRIKRRQEAQDYADSKEAALNSEKRTATRELAKEFVEKSLPGRTVQELKEDLTRPKERKRWQRSR